MTHEWEQQGSVLNQEFFRRMASSNEDHFKVIADFFSKGLLSTCQEPLGFDLLGETYASFWLVPGIFYSTNLITFLSFSLSGQGKTTTLVLKSTNQQSPMLTGVSEGRMRTAEFPSSSPVLTSNVSNL